MQMFRSLRLPLAGLLLLAGAQTLSAQTETGYRVMREFHIGGKGGWDYIAVNAAEKRIYVSHDTLTCVLDQETGDSAGVIPDTRGVHGIAFAPPFGKGYTSNGRANTLTVFDLKTNAVKGEVKAGANPDAIMYDPFSRMIIVCNGRSADATIVDPAADTVVATIPLGGKPEAPVSDGAGAIYINIEDKNEVVRLATAGWKVEQRWKTGTGESPTGIAMDRTTKRLFVGCDKLMIVLNAETGAVVAQIPIGDRCDGTAFDPGTKTAFASCGDGTLTVVSEVSADSFRVVGSVPTKRGARTLALDEATHRIYLPTAQYEPAPAPTADNPRPRAKIIPGTFEVLVVGK
jgi:DNA-binding beta-propeller fold protein YncE